MKKQVTYNASCSYTTSWNYYVSNSINAYYGKVTYMGTIFHSKYFSPRKKAS